MQRGDPEQSREGGDGEEASSHLAPASPTQHADEEVRAPRYADARNIADVVGCMGHAQSRCVSAGKRYRITNPASRNGWMNDERPGE